MIRVLLLSHAFPPGVQRLYPHLIPAGHGFETQMVRELQEGCDLRTVGLLPFQPPDVPDADPASGVAHRLVLVAQTPPVLGWWRALRRLKAAYRDWCASGWQPDVVLAYGMQPVWNGFMRWLGRRREHPRRVLLLTDSSQLGQPMPRLKRLRYRLKPLVVLDEDMLREFEACIGLSDATERFFAPRGVPFLWMPGGCRKDPIPEPGPAALSTDRRGPVRFGYFGALADHSGIRALVEAHRKLDIDAELHVCGYGRLSDWVAAAAALDPRMHWHGLRPSQEDCLRLAQGWDVLVNPRPASHGNENNFPSKLFEYAACGRAILTTDLSGSGRVLGPEAFYMKASCLPAELELQLAAIARLPRAELARKGKLLQERVRAGYSWPIQVERMIRFMGQVKDLPARS